MSQRLARSRILLWLTVAVAAWLTIGTGINNAEFISTPNPLSKGEWMMFAIFAGMLSSLIIVLIWARRAIPISKVREIRGFEPIVPALPPVDGNAEKTRNE
jgi:hypothetical protein